MRRPPLAAAGLGLAVVGLALAPDSSSFDLLGHSLGPLVRDVRVFNDFEDAAANDNLAPDPMFPGATGAPLAIWKAAVEWGSALHGDGTGDPTQFDGLGSGEANFDFSWQGLALGPGGLTDNTHSALHADDVGVLAFAEFGQGGWRIRYYENWTWDDGPGAIPAQHYDLQSCAAHELGHALGLGHSSFLTTMSAVQSGGDTSKRSLLGDDRAGVQAIYGVRSVTKPRITSASWDGLQLTIAGTGFAATGNEVWFTRAQPSPSGQVPRVDGVPSSGSGTLLMVTVPPEAGSGDVLVRIPGPGGGATLSNAWPVTLACEPIASTCPTTANSAGPGAVLSAVTTQSVSANDLALHASGVVPNQFGLVFYGASAASLPVAGGTLCIGAPLYRLAPVQASAQGQLGVTVDLTAPPAPAGTIQPGQTWLFQLWYRDPAGGSGSDFSNALAIPFCP